MCAAVFHKPRIDFERAFDRSIYAAGQRNRLDAGFEVGFSEQDENTNQAVGSVFQDVIQNRIHTGFRTVGKDRVASDFYICLKQLFQMRKPPVLEPIELDRHKALKCGNRIIRNFSFDFPALVVIDLNIFFYQKRRNNLQKRNQNQADSDQRIFPAKIAAEQNCFRQRSCKHRSMFCHQLRHRVKIVFHIFQIFPKPGMIQLFKGIGKNRPILFHFVRLNRLLLFFSERDFQPAVKISITKHDCQNACCRRQNALRPPRKRVRYLR